MQQTVKGLEFLVASFNEFNGSGYADRTNAQAMVDSYIDYSNWRGRFENALLAQEHHSTLLPMATRLIETSFPKKTVSKKFMDKFNSFRKGE